MARVILEHNRPALMHGPCAKPRMYIYTLMLLNIALSCSLTIALSCSPTIALLLLDGFTACFLIVDALLLLVTQR